MSTNPKYMHQDMIIAQIRRYRPAHLFRVGPAATDLSPTSGLSGVSGILGVSDGDHPPHGTNLIPSAHARCGSSAALGPPGGSSDVERARSFTTFSPCSTFNSAYSHCSSLLACVDSVRPPRNTSTVTDSPPLLYLPLPSSIQTSRQSTRCPVPHHRRGI